jgi:hypothetical protein
MKSLVKSALAAVAASVALAGCATYDYGSGYGYTQPDYGYDYGYNYGYDYGPYPYDYTPYYNGPSYYVAPSVGLGFTYRDYDGRNHDRNSDRHRRGDNDQWRGDHASRGTATRPTVTQPNEAPANSRSHLVAPPPAQASGRNDPWGGTNNPDARNSQQ